MNSKQTMIFNENMCRTVFPGMVDSIRTLIEYRTTERGRNFHAGYINSAVILRTCFKKKDTIQELMFTFNHWSSPY